MTDDGRGRVVPIASNSLGTLGELEVLYAYATGASGPSASTGAPASTATATCT